MASPLVDALDRGLARNGEDVVLRRVIGNGSNTTNIDVTCRALVRSFRLDTVEIAPALAQNILVVILSPTQIRRAQWPGGTAPQDPAKFVDPSIPRRLDILVIKDRVRTIESVDPIDVDGEIVRFNIKALG